MNRGGILAEPLMADTEIREQIQIEEESIALGLERYRNAREAAIKRGDAGSLKPVERLVVYWLRSVERATAREQRDVRRGRAAPHRHIYGPVLLLIKPDKAALIGLQTALGMLVERPTGEKFTKVAYAIGRDIVAEANADLCRQLDKRRWDEVHAMRADPDISEAEAEEARKDALHGSFSAMTRNVKRLTPAKINWWAKRNLDQTYCNRVVCVQLGSWVLWNLINTTELPAVDGGGLAGIVHFYRQHKNKRVGCVRLGEAAWDVIRDGDARRSFLRPRFLPMVTPPLPWSDGQAGGYVRLRPPFVVTQQPLHRRLMAEHDLGDVFRAINAINAPGRRINRRMLEAVERIYDEGGGQVGIPLKHNVPVPDRIDAGSEAEAKANRADRAEAFKMNKEILPSLRQTFLLQLGVARKFRNRSAIYFPHRPDFRGRIYPKPQPLNHQGPDLCRGLLEWAKPVEATASGMRWIRIHAANCFGMDKLRLDERVQWSEAHRAEMVRCARDPADTDWWRSAESPLQFLAACMAIDDPEQAAHLTVDIDGKCNGLAHYAALGRDPRGAAETSLIDANEPGDIYSTVTALAHRAIKAEAEGGLDLARALLPLVQRAVCKRPVMTYVYGVTFYGASTHIRDTLRELGLAPEWITQGSRHLARHILSAVESVCSQAAEIMAWLRDIAARVCATGRPVCWVAPSGFPVGQAYYNRKKYQVTTATQKVTLHIDDEDLGPNRREQIAGISPNYIHSIDASHMLAVAKTAYDTGMDFAGIHDSFASHAEHMDALGAIVRDEFVRLHKRPLLHELRSQINDRYRIRVPEPPAAGDFDLDLVRQSTYAFC